MKYFFDIEGTIASKPIGTGSKGTMTLHDILFGDSFIKMKPDKKFQELIKTLDVEDLFVIGTIDSKEEIEQKEIWTEKHFPNITRENQFYISSNYNKVDVIIAVANERKISLNEIVFVDDKISNIEMAKSRGLIAKTPKEFWRTKR